MPTLDVILAIRDGQLSPYLTPGQTPEAMATFEVERRQPGFHPRREAAVAVIELPSGQRVLAETSWRNMALALVALAATWGTP